MLTPRLLSPSTYYRTRPTSARRMSLEPLPYDASQQLRMRTGYLGPTTLQQYSMAIGDTMNEGDYDTDRLRTELQQEKQMKEMLEQSTQELRITVSELEKRLDGVGEEGNEWKTRYETQEELNQQLEKQILMLKDKIDDAKQSARDGNTSQMKSYDELSEAALKKLIRRLDRDKLSLDSQMRDYEWRLDQESKAFHKANDERKNYLTEISQAAKIKHNDAKSSIDEIKKRNAFGGGSYSDPMASPRSYHNVPDNQRILDPRRGPIKKTAAVKQLPKLH
uniref:Coiled-coil domain-containing protein 169-like n=1 Tax=Saccoglossus kowalevskii TaxID=10224 RepID=A0ABM0MQJ4_SACKO|nr:PREDICTED: coiled-coil domain-containing protein 169-like [Saccoglossus kowalevskii]